MDPIAHTLVGAALAQTGLRDRTRYATVALVISANLPDIDAITVLGHSDMALCWRRGWTHGVLAMAIMPTLLAGALVLFDRLRSGFRTPADGAALLRLSYLGFLTHLLLDWMNTYGVRLLKPFEERWFYGDVLYIVDPWIWLLLGGAVFLSHSKRALSLLAWLVGGSLAMAFVWMAAPANLLVAKLTWAAGAVVFLLLRIRRSFFAEHSAAGLAKVMLAVTTVYIGLMVVSARYARDWVSDELARRGTVVERLMVGPVVVTPLTREVVAQTPYGYRFGMFHYTPAPQLVLDNRVIPKPGDSAVVREALALPGIQGFVHWARFPYVEVDEEQVRVFDARYARAPVSGFGMVTVPR